MDKAVLLEQLRSLLAAAPDFDSQRPITSQHHAWLAKGYALISRWDQFEGIAFTTSSNLVHLPTMRDMQAGMIMGAIHRAISDLEVDRPRPEGQAFKPGAVYDFFRSLSAIVSSASSNLFIVDPYLDLEIFDKYLTGLSPGVRVRLLALKYGQRLAIAAQQFSTQHDVLVEVRSSRQFHDRVLFIDELSCWVVGQSLKDAAAKKPTYLIPLDTEIAQLKLNHYEQLWVSATALQTEGPRD